MSENKSVIIRGSIAFPKHPENFIYDVVSSIREWFDGELIISTWEDQEQYLQNISGVDKIIYSKDPGPGPVQEWKRQVVSFREGFLASSGDKLLVTRSDICHYKDPFIHLDTYPKKYSKNLNLFKNKLVISNIMSISPNSKELPNTFRLSDWFHVGYREDIDIWCDILNEIDCLDKTYPYIGCTEKMWFLSALKSKFDVDLRSTVNIDSMNIDAIMNNFIILNTVSTLGAINKNWEFQPETLDFYIKESDYINLYNTL